MRWTLLNPLATSTFFQHVSSSIINLKLALDYISTIVICALSTTLCGLFNFVFTSSLAVRVLTRLDASDTSGRPLQSHARTLSCDSRP